jgi:hypothetical protein
MSATVQPDPFVVICIPTTPQRSLRLETCVASIRRCAGYAHYAIMTYMNVNEGYVKAIHTLLQTLAPDQLVWCIADDIIIEEPDTLKRLVNIYTQTFPQCDGVVSPNDGIQNGRIATMPLTTSRIMRDNTLTCFFHNYADNIFTERMRALGKYRYADEVHVTHAHWCVGKSIKDTTYQLALDKLRDDERMYISLTKPSM